MLEFDLKNEKVLDFEDVIEYYNENYQPYHNGYRLLE